MYYTIHPVLRGVRTLGEDGGPEIQLGRPDIFFPALSVSLHIHPFLLPLVLYIISFLLFPSASVWGNTSARVPHFLWPS